MASVCTICFLASGMVYYQGSASDTRNSSFQKEKMILPLEKGAGGFPNSVHKVLP
jgi:hypothetical protein